MSNGTGNGPIRSDEDTRELVARHDVDIKTIKEDIRGIFDAISQIAKKQEKGGIQWAGVSVAVALSVALASLGWLMTRLALQPVALVAQQAVTDAQAARMERDRSLQEDLRLLKSEHVVLARQVDEEREGRWVREAQRNEADRVRIWEQVRASEKAIAELRQQLDEVETQFDWATDAHNSALAHSDRLDAILWRKAFGEDLPPIQGNGVGPEGKQRK